jgi:hypothetical protein
MAADFRLLHVDGPRIVNGRHEDLRLRGFCLGGWMNMENFILGYPGHESGFRAAMARVLGEDKARFFFERFVHYFIGEDDLCFLKRSGCNVIRIPLNYRHFESDGIPFEYKEEGFALLDRAVGWARNQGLYVILDLHAVQGWQNRGWHCDNGCRTAHFFGQRVFEDRAVALWEELAGRYRSEPFLAGYNLMNEPDADEVKWLNHFYRRATDAIRAIDPNHIIFLEGNRYSQQFDELDPPFDKDTVYSSHNYAVPATEEMAYPGEFKSESYDRSRLEREYDERTAYMMRHGVPNWVGEFGAIFGGETSDASRLQVLADQIEMIETRGHHWSIWTYKDIGKMGLVCLDPSSEWMRRTRPVREAKRLLRCDHWIEKQPGSIDPLLPQIGAAARKALPDLPLDAQQLEAELSGAVCETTLAQALLPAFAEQFRGMTEEEIDRMMQSFAFVNCVPRSELVRLLDRRLGRHREAATA